MGKGLLREIEIWQQNYNFNYNCFDSLIEHIESVRIYLLAQNISTDNLSISRIFKNGNLYNKTEDQVIDVVKKCIGTNIRLPPNMLNLNYRNSYLGGQLTNHIERINFKEEFERYFENLNLYLKEKMGIKNLPLIKELDLDLFMMAYALKSDCYVNKEKDFSDYLYLVSYQNPTSLSVSEIGRNHLNNPLFFDFISSAIYISLRPELRENLTLNHSGNNAKWLELVYETVIDLEDIKKAS